MKSKLKTGIFCLCIYCSTAALGNQQIKPAFADEQVRQAKVDELLQNSKLLKRKAEIWALARSMPLRFTREGVLHELMAVVDGHPLYNITLNENAAISTAADVVRDTAPYNVNGANNTVGIWDGGHARATHQEFVGRVTTNDNGGSSGVHYHSTHVCGTIAAAGVVAAAQGMAPQVMINSYDWNDDEAEMANRGAALPNQAGKLYLSNHSYGSGVGWDSSGTYWPWDITVTADSWFGRYSSFSREWDDIAYNAPYYLICKSSGNDRNDEPSNGSTVYYWKGSWVAITYTNGVHPAGDGLYKGGYDCIPHKGVAKNILTVGAVYNAVLSGTRYLPNATMSTFSSWGPADDGRIKPDVVGDGVSLYSTGSGSDIDYIYLSGTSMASPNVCGSALLLIELYRGKHSFNVCRASTLKGLLIHTADDLGNPGPDYIYGWGLVNTKSAADIILKDAAGDPEAFLYEGLLNSSNSADDFDVIIDGTEPLTATICWTDPPGVSTTAHDNRTPVLVNDLDLRITTPGGTDRFPFTLSYLNPSATAVTGDNSVDTVEQVFIDVGAAPGTYTVKVSHKGILTDGQQNYSLVVSGAIPEPGISGLALLCILAGLKKRFG